MTIPYSLVGVVIVLNQLRCIFRIVNVRRFKTTSSSVLGNTVILVKIKKLSFFWCNHAVVGDLANAGSRIIAVILQTIVVINQGRNETRHSLLPVHHRECYGHVRLCTRQSFGASHGSQMADKSKQLKSH